MSAARFRLPLAAAGLSLWLCGCGSDALPSTSAATSGAGTAPTSGCVTAAVPSTPDTFSDVVTTTKQADGLEIGDFKVGSGPTPRKGDTITVQYTGWLSDGTVFDSSRKTGRTPFSFALGTGAVIPGWDEGLATMHIGGKRRLVIPPALGYGAQANGPIPANSTLVFDVTLLSIGSGCPTPT
jgi:peptidylprolyl isomerase